MKLKTKRGRLTAYGLACGYAETAERGDIRLTLSHEGGPVYHVKACDRNGRLRWETFAKLTDARRDFNAFKHAFRLKTTKE